MRTSISILTALTLIGHCHRALAQQWVFDAREIAMGATGREGIVSSDMIARERPSVSIVLPFGFLQIFRNPAIYDRDSTDFDPIRAVEYASAPFHYVVGRDEGDAAGVRFVSDIRNSILDRDLSRYRGFAPVTGRLAETATSSFGHTFRWRETDRFSQGFYVGAGPYLSVETSGAVDPALSDLLDGQRTARNARFGIAGTDEAQIALALTVGYRARFPWPEHSLSRSARDGLYVGANYHYLRGMLYEHDDLNLRLETDAAGLLLDSSNVIVDRRHASDGTGFALDAGASAVLERWQIGVGINGLLNRIDWAGVNGTTYSVASLTSGRRDFIRTTTLTDIETRVVLPVEYRSSVRYTADGWAATGGAGHGLGGITLHAGVERRLERFELRGGGHYRFGVWNPNTGAGFAITPRISADVAVFGTSANLQRTRRMGIAASIRVSPK